MNYEKVSDGNSISSNEKEKINNHEFNESLGSNEEIKNEKHIENGNHKEVKNEQRMENNNENASNITKDTVMKKLSEVIDPEIGADVVSMDLIKDVAINDGSIHIKMTLTTPGCPLADMIIGEVKYKLSEIPGVKNVNVEIVF